MEGLQVSPARPHLLPWLALPGLLAACSQSPALEGSLSTLLDLRYEGAEARLDDKGTADRLEDDELSVSFFTYQAAPPQGPDAGPAPEPGERPRNFILQVSARLEGLTPEQRLDVDLAEQVGRNNAPRGTIARIVLDEPVRPFPPIARGRLSFQSPLVPGATVRGSFNATFANGTLVYSGHTVFGRFEAQVPNPGISNP